MNLFINWWSMSYVPMVLVLYNQVKSDNLPPANKDARSYLKTYDKIPTTWSRINDTMSPSFYVYQEDPNRYSRCDLTNSLMPGVDSTACINYDPYNIGTNAREDGNLNYADDLRNFQSIPYQHLQDGDETTKVNFKPYDRDILQEILNISENEDVLRIKLPSNIVLPYKTYINLLSKVSEIPHDLVNIILPSEKEIPLHQYQNFIRNLLPNKNMVSIPRKYTSNRIKPADDFGYYNENDDKVVTNNLIAKPGTDVQKSIRDSLQSLRTIIIIPNLFEGTYKIFAPIIDNYLSEFGKFAQIRTVDGTIVDYNTFKNIRAKYGMSSASVKFKNRVVRLKNGFQTDLESLRQAVNGSKDLRNVQFLFPNGTTIPFEGNNKETENIWLSNTTLVKFVKTGYSIQWPVFRDVLTLLGINHVGDRNKNSSYLEESNVNASDGRFPYSEYVENFSNNVTEENNFHTTSSHDPQIVMEESYSYRNRSKLEDDKTEKQMIPENGDDKTEKQIISENGDDKDEKQVILENGGDKTTTQIIQENVATKSTTPVDKDNEDDSRKSKTNSGITTKKSEADNSSSSLYSKIMNLPQSIRSLILRNFRSADDPENLSKHKQIPSSSGLNHNEFPSKEVDFIKDLAQSASNLEFITAKVLDHSDSTIDDYITARAETDEKENFAFETDELENSQIASFMDRLANLTDHQNIVDDDITYNSTQSDEAVFCNSSYTESCIPAYHNSYSHKIISPFLTNSKSPAILEKDTEHLFNVSSDEETHKNSNDHGNFSYPVFEPYDNRGTKMEDIQKYGSRLKLNPSPYALSIDEFPVHRSSSEANNNNPYHLRNHIKRVNLLPNSNLDNVFPGTLSSSVFNDSGADEDPKYNREKPCMYEPVQKWNDGSSGSSETLISHSCRMYSNYVEDKTKYPKMYSTDFMIENGGKQFLLKLVCSSPDALNEATLDYKRKGLNSIGVEMKKEWDLKFERNGTNDNIYPTQGGIERFIQNSNKYPATNKIPGFMQNNGNTYPNPGGTLKFLQTYEVAPKNCGTLKHIYDSCIMCRLKNCNAEPTEYLSLRYPSNPKNCLSFLKRPNTFHNPISKSTDGCDEILSSSFDVSEGPEPDIENQNSLAERNSINITFSNENPIQISLEDKYKRYPSIWDFLANILKSTDGKIKCRNNDEYESDAGPQMVSSHLRISENDSGENDQYYETNIENNMTYETIVKNSVPEDNYKHMSSEINSVRLLPLYYRNWHPQIISKNFEPKGTYINSEENDLRINSRKWDLPVNPRNWNPEIGRPNLDSEIRSTHFAENTFPRNLKNLDPQADPKNRSPDTNPRNLGSRGEYFGENIFSDKSKNLDPIANLKNRENSDSEEELTYFKENTFSKSNNLDSSFSLTNLNPEFNNRYLDSVVKFTDTRDGKIPGNSNNWDPSTNLRNWSPKTNPRNLNPPGESIYFNGNKFTINSESLYPQVDHRNPEINSRDLNSEDEFTDFNGNKYSPNSRNLDLLMNARNWGQEFNPRKSKVKSTYFGESKFPVNPNNLDRRVNPRNWNQNINHRDLNSEDEFTDYDENKLPPNSKNLYSKVDPRNWGPEINSRNVDTEVVSTYFGKSKFPVNHKSNELKSNRNNWSPKINYENLGLDDKSTHFGESKFSINPNNREQQVNPRNWSQKINPNNPNSVNEFTDFDENKFSPNLRNRNQQINRRNWSPNSRNVDPEFKSTYFWKSKFPENANNIFLKNNLKNLHTKISYNDLDSEDEFTDLDENKFSPITRNWDPPIIPSIWNEEIIPTNLKPECKSTNFGKNKFVHNYRNLDPLVNVRNPRPEINPSNVNSEVKPVYYGKVKFPVEPSNMDSPDNPRNWRSEIDHRNLESAEKSTDLMENKFTRNSINIDPLVNVRNWNPEIIPRYVDSGVKLTPFKEIKYPPNISKNDAKNIPKDWRTEIGPSDLGTETKFTHFGNENLPLNQANEVANLLLGKRFNSRNLEITPSFENSQVVLDSNVENQYYRQLPETKLDLSNSERKKFEHSGERKPFLNEDEIEGSSSDRTSKPNSSGMNIEPSFRDYKPTYPFDNLRYKLLYSDKLNQVQEIKTESPYTVSNHPSLRNFPFERYEKFIDPASYSLRELRYPNNDKNSHDNVTDNGRGMKILPSTGHRDEYNIHDIPSPIYRSVQPDSDIFESILRNNGGLGRNQFFPIDKRRFHDCGRNHLSRDLDSVTAQSVAKNESISDSSDVQERINIIPRRFVIDQMLPCKDYLKVIEDQDPNTRDFYRTRFFDPYRNGFQPKETSKGYRINE